MGSTSRAVFSFSFPNIQRKGGFEKESAFSVRKRHMPQQKEGEGWQTKATESRKALRDEISLASVKAEHLGMEEAV